jgi:hypothetical protein
MEGTKRFILKAGGPMLVTVLERISVGALNTEAYRCKADSGQELTASKSQLFDTYEAAINRALVFAESHLASTEQELSAMQRQLEEARADVERLKALKPPLTTDL